MSLHSKGNLVNQSFITIVFLQINASFRTCDVPADAPDASYPQTGGPPPPSGSSIASSGCKPFISSLWPLLMFSIAICFSHVSTSTINDWCSSFCFQEMFFFLFQSIELVIVNKQTWRFYFMPFSGSIVQPLSKDVSPIFRLLRKKKNIKKNSSANVISLIKS